MLVSFPLLCDVCVRRLIAAVALDPKTRFSKWLKTVQIGPIELLCELLDFSECMGVLWRLFLEL